MTKNNTNFTKLKRTIKGSVIVSPILALASVVSLGLQTTAQAAPVNPQKPLDAPTLDFLRQQNTQVLDTSRKVNYLIVNEIVLTAKDGSKKSFSVVRFQDSEPLSKSELNTLFNHAKNNGVYITKNEEYSQKMEIPMEEAFAELGISSYEELMLFYKMQGIPVIEEPVEPLLQAHLESLPSEFYSKPYTNVQSGYELVSVPNKDLPNTITKFEYDKDQGKLVPKFYQMQLKKTEFGNADAPNEFVYKTSLGQDISAKYDKVKDAKNIDLSTLQPTPEGEATIEGQTFTGQNDKGAIVGYNSLITKLNIKNSLFIKNNNGLVASNDVENVEADFINNNVGIAVDGNINSIKGNFIANEVGLSKTPYYGTQVNNVEGTFVNNGIGIYQRNPNSNSSIIDNINADFIGNTNALVNDAATIKHITGDFIQNKQVTKSDQESHYSFRYMSSGITNQGNINSIKGDFIENELQTDSVTAAGAAIYNSSSWSTYFSGPITINTIDGSFVANKVESLKADAKGGAIANINKGDRGNVQIGEIKNSQFFNNSAVAKNGVAKGGAIYSDNSLNIVADNGLTAFSGNTVTDKNGTRDEAIYLDYNSSLYANKLTLKAVNNGNIYIDDKVVGAPLPPNQPDPGYNEDYKGLNKLHITGDKSGLVVLNNNVEKLDVTLSDTNLLLGKRDNVLANNNVTFQSGNFSMINNQIGQTDFASFNLAGKTNMYVDVDLANETMDKLTANTYTGNGTLNVAGMNLLSDAKGEVTDIKFAETGLMDKVTNGVADLPTTYQTTAYTPIYKYNVVYDKRENDGGYFVFNKGGAIGGGGGSANNPSFENFNPAVTGSSTAAQAGALGTVNQTFNYAFQSSDMFMSIPYLERVAMRNENKYALSTTGDATDVNGVYSPIYTKETSGGVWVKPYASIESISLKNGPKVDNTTYGTLVGFDSDLTRVKNGWDRVITGYVGYTGASQHYAGVDSVQNGGLVGGTLTMYKGNFFNATTLSVGANVAQNDNMYGKEDFTMLMSGIANKSGYNLEFKEGKLILQPSMMMSYTFVNTFDYTNAAGVRIENKPLHAIQLSPGVKVVGNLKDGWQPYASASMVWNLMGESDATANGVQLAKMSVKPYVQYGVGVQKRVKDNFTAYGQAMVQNGGRNGISLSGGCRWLVGKGPKDVEKVDNGTKTKYTKERTVLKSIGQKVASGEKTILKQLSPAQKAALRGDKFNTTRTVSSGILRQI